MTHHVSPPWLEFPGYPPGAFFWREAGQPWFIYVWEPFWKSLSEVEQQTYLEKYQVPYEWQYFYFEPEFKTWLDEVDLND